MSMSCPITHSLVRLHGHYGAVVVELVAHNVSVLVQQEDDITQLYSGDLTFEPGSCMDDVWKGWTVEACALGDLYAQWYQIATGEEI